MDEGLFLSEGGVQIALIRAILIFLSSTRKAHSNSSESGNGVSGKLKGKKEKSTTLPLILLHDTF